MKYFLFFFTLTLSFLCSAENLPEKKIAKGLVLLGVNEPLLSPDKLEQIEGIELVGCDLPGDKNYVMGELRKLFQQTPFTSDMLGSFRQILYEHYDAYGKPFVLIDIPEQEISQGVVQFRIQEGLLGKILIQGQRWTSPAQLTQYLDLKPQQPINEIEVFRGLYAMNSNPFRRVDALYSPGMEEGTTDLALQVKDRFPLRVYAGSDNTGLEPIDDFRWFTGLNWNLPFGWDQILSYQYTSACEMNRFHAHTGQYLVIFPWKHSLSIYGGYNEVEPKHQVSAMLKNSGWGLQGSLRYQFPLRIRRFLEEQLAWGADFKRTNNTFVFTDASSNFGKNVNLFQLVLAYSGIYERNQSRLDFEGNLYGSFGKCFDDQTNADYQTLRIGAKNKWIYFRGGLCYLQKIYKASLSFAARGQATTTALLPSEQFGLGGYDTVRGYQERVINKDNALVLNLELRSPSSSVFSHLCRRYSDAIELLAFADYGWGVDKILNPPGSLSEFLIGVGPGIRYTWEPYLTGRLDMGFKLHKNPVIGTSISRFHFSLILSI